MIIDDQRIHQAVHAWIERMVVGLNLCPFAAAPLRQGQVRVAISDGNSPAEVLTDLVDEAFGLNVADPGQVSTTLLVLPRALGHFPDFNDFLDVAEGAIDALGMADSLQLASFHPAYRFADTGVDDPGNYSNRAPFPVLHLLREVDVSRAVDQHPDTAKIYQDNIRRLEELGTPQLRVMLADCGFPPAGNDNPGLE